MLKRCLFATVPLALLAAAAQAQFIDLHQEGMTYSSASGGSGSQVVGTARFSGSLIDNHVVVWNGVTATDIHPTDLFSSSVSAFSGDRIVGTGTTDVFSGATRALLWESGVVSDITPLSASSAAASGIDGNQIVGTAIYSSGARATLWEGGVSSLLSVENLAAGRNYNSRASSISGDTIVGSFNIRGNSISTSQVSYAVRWENGNAIDLAPGFSPKSVATLATGDYIYGYAAPSLFDPLAPIRWTTDGYATDLTPIGLFEGGVAGRTELLGGLGSIAVGSFSADFTFDRDRAVLWQGDRVWNLHELMGLDDTMSSMARGVDAEGNVYGSYVVDLATRETHAFRFRFDAASAGAGLEINGARTYVPGALRSNRVPEPGTLALLALGALAGLALRRRK